MGFTGELTTHMVRKLCGIVFLTSERQREG